MVGRSVGRSVHHQGSGEIMRIGHETELRLDPVAIVDGDGVATTAAPGVTITIHEPIEVEVGDTVESLRDRSAAVMQAALVRADVTAVDAAAGGENDQ